MGMQIDMCYCEEAPQVRGIVPVTIHKSMSEFTSTTIKGKMVSKGMGTVTGALPQGST